MPLIIICTNVLCTNIHTDILTLGYLTCFPLSQTEFKHDTVFIINVISIWQFTYEFGDYVTVGMWST